MITPKDKIGYIRRATIDGKEQFKFIDAKVKSVRIGKNAHDDAQDTTTGVYENLPKKKQTSNYTSIFM